ncbi:MAG TPA: hypothetical protein VGK85_14545 [Myxococcaceae bacterium]
MATSPQVSAIAHLMSHPVGSSSHDWRRASILALPGFRPFADPHAQLGYAYFPNRMGTSLEDPRDIALRAAVYRCLGEASSDARRPLTA